MADTVVLPEFAPENVWEWTADEVQSAIEAGVLKDPEHFELLGGRLIRKMAKGEAHILVHSLLMQALVVAFAPNHLVRSEAPVALSRTTEPEPDFLVVPRETVGNLSRPRGDQAILAIEISVTSLKDDLGWKKDLYAQAGIPEYWVIDCEGRRVFIHRHPFGRDYRNIEILHEEDALPGLSIRVSDVLP
ncbi:Uma2 family endonuclease [soil metagenome]